MKAQTDKQSLVEPLFGALTDSLKKIGYERTLYLLKRGHDTHENENFNYATNAVCKVFNISSDVLFNRSRKYPRKYAFAIWVYVAYNNLHCTINDIAFYTNRSKLTIIKSKQLAEQFDNNSPFEKQMNQNIQSVIELLNELKK